MSETLFGMSQDFVASRFDYEEDTGGLFWANGKFAGKFAGSLFRAEHGKFYWRTKLHGNAVFNHRIIWFIKTGTCPRLIDHWDGDGQNNAWINLRDATLAQNQANRDDLIRGIDPFPNGKWRAKITVNYKQMHLGMYDSKEEALAVYMQALIDIHGEYAVYNRRLQSEPQ
jgi:hypothetical protein